MKSFEGGPNQLAVLNHALLDNKADVAEVEEHGLISEMVFDR